MRGGVKNGADVAAALELGASGVLLASGVTKAMIRKPYSMTWFQAYETPKYWELD